MVWAQWCLKHRIKTTLVAIAFLVGSLMLVPLLPTGFIPPDDLAQTQVTVSLPPSSTFARTFAAAEQARALLRKNPHVKFVYTAIGGGRAGGDPFAAQGAAEVRTATLTINMTPRQDRSGTSKQDIEADLHTQLEALPGAHVKVGFGGSSKKYVLVLAGEDGRVLGEHARQVERELRTIPGNWQRHLHLQPQHQLRDRAQPAARRRGEKAALALPSLQTPGFRSPMAIVVIVGLITSTFLSLLVIPVVFTYVDDVVLKINGWLHRKRRGAGWGGGCGGCAGIG